MSEKNEKVDVQQENLLKAALRRAEGYTACETVEEYSIDSDGQIQLVRKKVTTKDVAPDVSALKMLLDNVVDEQPITYAELENKRRELIEMFKGEINGTDKKQIQDKV